MKFETKVFVALALAAILGVSLVPWARQGMFQLAEDVSQSQQTPPK